MLIVGSCTHLSNNLPDISDTLFKPIKEHNTLRGKG